MTIQTAKTATNAKTVLRTIPVPNQFKNILTTVVANHPKYKNTTKFVLECFEYGANEIKIDTGILKKKDQLVIESSGLLSEHITNELKDFLSKNTAESIIDDPNSGSTISLNIDKDSFLQLKSLVPLSKYCELRTFYIHQIYKGLERLI